jgi:hypothetical protein
MLPAARRTWKPDGFSVQRFAGCAIRSAGYVRQLARRGNRPVSPSNASRDPSNRPMDASPERRLRPATRRTWKLDGFSIRRLARRVQRTAGSARNLRNGRPGSRPPRSSAC